MSASLCNGLQAVPVFACRCTATNPLAPHHPHTPTHPRPPVALLNGTTVMTGIAACTVHDASHLLELALGAAAMTSEALHSSPDYYAAAIQAAKHHPGQAAVAATLRVLLAGSHLAVPLEAIRQQLEGCEREALRRHDVVSAGVCIQRLPLYLFLLCACWANGALLPVHSHSRPLVTFSPSAASLLQPLLAALRAAGAGPRR